MPPYRTALVFIVLTNLLAFAAPSPALEERPPLQERVQVTDDLELVREAPGVWRHVFQIPLSSGPFPANGLVVINGGEALVIDTPWTEAQTTKLLDWIAHDLDVKVVAVVATHHHQDRLGGFAIVHGRGIPTFGHKKTAQLVDLEKFEAPQNVFRKKKTLKVGEQELELFFPGAGHSPDNIVVWLPQEKLLFGGCLLKDSLAKGLGFLGDANLENWPKAVDKVDQAYTEATLVVPGHKEPDGRKAIAKTLQLLQERQGQAE